MSHFRSLLVIVALCAFSFINSQLALGHEFPYKTCHLVSKQRKTVAASFLFDVCAPQLVAREWIFYAPFPPKLETQQELTGIELLVNDRPFQYSLVEELSPLHRRVTFARVGATDSRLRREFSTRMRYQLNLASKHLVEGAGVPLEALEHPTQFLTVTKLMDYQSKDFQDWLTANDLHRRSGERDLNFAWRAYEKIRQLCVYEYDPTQERCVSKLCKTNATDCGGLSCLFCSTLRANKVPARLLVGRWLKEDAAKDAGANSYGGCHVKAEFFAQDIGWIPVEMSKAVSNKYVSGLEFFGSFGGDFITFHVDPDLFVDSVWFGTSYIPFMQSPLFWVTGDGTLDGKTIEKTWQTRIER